MLDSRLVAVRGSATSLEFNCFPVLIGNCLPIHNWGPQSCQRPGPVLTLVSQYAFVSRKGIHFLLPFCQQLLVAPFSILDHSNSVEGKMPSDVRSALCDQSAGSCSSTDGLQAPATRYRCDSVKHSGVDARFFDMSSDAIVLGNTAVSHGDSTADESGLVTWCVDVWQAWLRTAVLMQLLAFVRLLVIGSMGKGRSPCKGCQPTVTRRLSVMLRGVPCMLALCVCVPVAEAAATPGSLQCRHIATFDGPSSLPLPNLCSPITVEFGYHGRPGPEDVALDAEGTIPMPQTDAQPEDNIRFVSEVLHFQRSSSFTFHCAALVPDLDALIDEVLEQISLEATEEQLTTVQPQPCTDRPVFIASHRRTDVSDDVPICVEVEVRGSRSLFWMDFIPAKCSYAMLGIS